MIQRIAPLAACTIVAVGIVLALGVLGSPGHQRLISLDLRRVSDLDAIVQTIDDRNPATAPTRLWEIRADLPRYAQLLDPVSAKPYEYHRKGLHRYELCAIFSLAENPNDTSDWNHPAGRWCRWFSV